MTEWAPQEPIYNRGDKGYVGYLITLEMLAVTGGPDSLTIGRVKYSLKGGCHWVEAAVLHNLTSRGFLCCSVTGLSLTGGLTGMVTKLPGRLSYVFPLDQITAARHAP